MKNRRRLNGFTIVEMVIVVAAVSAVMAAVVPSLLRVREEQHRTGCILNLKSISVAKDTWALDHKAKTGAAVPMDDLAKTYLHTPVSGPLCPEGGTYDVNVVGVSPTCSLGKTAKHVITKP